jgi:hypothetical protein
MNDSGTPICPECGADYGYDCTVVRQPKRRTVDVTVEGGVIQHIEHIPAGIKVRVIDFDTDGTPPNELTTLRNGSTAIVSVYEGKL